MFQGRVQADGEPLASQFVPRCFGVIQKIAVEEHWKYWNSVTRTWYIRLQNKPPKCLFYQSTSLTGRVLFLFQEFPDNEQKRNQQRSVFQSGEPWSLHHWLVCEGSKPSGGLWVLPGEGLFQSKTRWGGLGGLGGAGPQRGETCEDRGVRGAAAGGEHPDWFRWGGARRGPGDEAAGPAGWPQVYPGTHWPQELLGQAWEISQHVEDADCC